MDVILFRIFNSAKRSKTREKFIESNVFDL